MKLGGWQKKLRDFNIYNKLRNVCHTMPLLHERYKKELFSKLQDYLPSLKWECEEEKESQNLLWLKHGHMSIY